MTQELDPLKKTTEEQLRDEHNASSSSRRTISGPLVIPYDQDNSRSLAPITKAISGVAVEINKADDDLEHGVTYRVVCPQVGFYLLEGTGDATNTDLYIPAGEVIYLELNKSAKRYSVLGEGAGTIQFQQIGK